MRNGTVPGAASKAAVTSQEDLDVQKWSHPMEETLRKANGGQRSHDALPCEKALDLLWTRSKEVREPLWPVKHQLDSALPLAVDGAPAA